MKRRHSLLALLLVLGLYAHAQEEPTTVYRQYATQQYMKELLAAHPEVAETRSAIERHTYDWLRFGLPDTPTIALVFHVVGTPASAITMADINKQVDALNRDFSDPAFPGEAAAHQAWHAERFSERAARPSIRFCLANQSPGGGPGGVLYVPSQVPEFAVGAGVMNAQQGGSAAWDPQHYLNVFIAQLDGGVAGFAQMPGGPTATDGVVINMDYFSRNNQQGPNGPPPGLEKYSAGRTLAHLIGSYLNLYELWNDDQPCTDDNVHDTPIHNAPNYGEPGYRHISTCGDNPVEMTMNVMDNTDDVGQYMFTNGQVMRMYATLATEGGPRAGLREAPCSGGGLGGEPTMGRAATGHNAGQTGGKLAISLFPNPASEGFTVVVKSPCESSLWLTAHNAIGVLVHNQQLEVVAGGTNSIYVGTRGWAPGMHSVQVRCGQETASAKLVIER